MVTTTAQASSHGNKVIYSAAVGRMELAKTKMFFLLVNHLDQSTPCGGDMGVVRVFIIHFLPLVTPMGGEMCGVA